MSYVFRLYEEGSNQNINDWNNSVKYSDTLINQIQARRPPWQE